MGRSDHDLTSIGSAAAIMKKDTQRKQQTEDRVFKAQICQILDLDWTQLISQTCSPNSNPPLNSTENPVAVTFEQPLFFPPNFCQNMTDIINGSWGSITTAPNNNFPLHSSNSNPAASTPELPSSNSHQNTQNMMGGSSGAPADSNIDTPNYCPSTLAELARSGKMGKRRYTAATPRSL